MGRYITITLSLKIYVRDFPPNSYIWWYDSATLKGTSRFESVNCKIFELFELLQNYIQNVFYLRGLDCLLLDFHFCIT